MKKILIFSTAYIPFIGGAEIAVKEITDRLSSDFEFFMITLNLDGVQKKEEHVGAVHVYRIGGPRKIGKLIFPFTAYQKAIDLHRAIHFDMTWSIMASFGGFAARFFKKKFPEIPYILTLQEGDPIPEIEHKVRFVKKWFTEIFTLADRVQVISNYLGDWAKTIGVHKPIVVIPNGVSVQKFSGQSLDVRNTIREKTYTLSEQDICLITTSRLEKKNAVDVIIDALALLSEKYSLLILGTGSLEASLKQQVVKLNLERRVIFQGLQQEKFVISSLHASDVFIRPSRSEGMGNSFIEAMAANVPVVATPVGGIVDFLKDGATGFFCTVDDPQSVADCVLRYEHNPDLKKTIIQNAKKMVVDKYNWDVIANDMKEKVFTA